MYSLDEAAAERDAQESQKNRPVISRLPSFKPKAIAPKTPDFFKRLFSTRNLNKIQVGDDSDEDEKKVKDGDEGKLDEHKEEHKDEDAPKDRDEEEDPELDQVFSSDPLMPSNAKPIEMKRLINRNIQAEEGMNALMEMINQDVAIAIHNAQHIPVTKEIDRVFVTPEASAYMAKVRTQTGIEKRFKGHMTEIQKSLNYRKSAIIMMNANYSNAVVRKIEPIYVNEARTIVNLK